jgi:hypothetical protein
LSVRREPGPTTEATLAPPPPVRLQGPEPLPRTGEGKAAVPASAERIGKGSSTPIRVRVTGLPPSRRTGSMGIGVFATAPGADLAWAPLSAAAEQPDGSLLVPVEVPLRGEVTVTLAADRFGARHGYFARTTATIAAGSDVELGAGLAAVAFRLPGGAVRAGPLTLLRADDPRWLPPGQLTIGLQIEGDEPLVVLLGAGDYELRDPLDAARRQRFAVAGPAAGSAAPQPVEIEISESLLPARAGRL